MWWWLFGGEATTNRIGVAGIHGDWEPYFRLWADQVAATYKCKVAIEWMNGKQPAAPDAKIIAQGRHFPIVPNQIIVRIGVPDRPTNDNIPATQPIVAQAIRDILDRLTGR
jgi:hypothetical protein